MAVKPDNALHFFNGRSKVFNHQLPQPFSRVAQRSAKFRYGLAGQVFRQKFDLIKYTKIRIPDKICKIVFDGTQTGVDIFIAEQQFAQHVNGLLSPYIG